MGALANARASSGDAGSRTRAESGGGPESSGARMKELGRLLRYSRPYAPHLFLSMILMACVGAAQALTALLIGPGFDRVLTPASADAPVALFTMLGHTLYLDQLVPMSIHNVWTMVAVAILAISAI